MKVIIKNFQKKIPINPRSIRKTVLNTLSLEGIKKSGGITICFTNDKQMRELNLMYRGQYNPTDVISFDISESNKEILADIVISTDTAIRNAKIFKTTHFYELYLYVIHGILHILGYDDKNVIETKKMEKETNRILTALKLNNNPSISLIRDTSKTS